MTSGVKAVLYSRYEKVMKSRRMESLRYVPGSDFVFRLLWPYGNVIEVQGSKMYVDVNEESPSMRTTFKMYALFRIHEETTTELFRRFVKKGDRVVDIGANIGYFTLLSATLVGPKGKVHAFEPEPKNFGYLKKNIALNGYDHVVPNQKAVGEDNGKVKLFICSYDTGHHTINQYEGIKDYKPDLAAKKPRSVEVEKVTLDSYLNGKTVDVIKMDVEGAECLALMGMEKTLKGQKKLTMFVEFFPFLIRKMGSSPEDFVRKLLNDYGFTVYVVAGDYYMNEESRNDLLRASKVEDVTRFCTEEGSHVNLLLRKGYEREDTFDGG